MDKNIVIEAVNSSLTKAECLSRMNMEHTIKNYRELSKCIEKNGIDISHLQGMKATTYLKHFQPQTDMI